MAWTSLETQKRNIMVKTRSIMICVLTIQRINRIAQASGSAPDWHVLVIGFPSVVPLGGTTH